MTFTTPCHVRTLAATSPRRHEPRRKVLIYVLRNLRLQVFLCGWPLEMHLLTVHTGWRDMLLLSYFNWARPRQPNSGYL